VRYAWIAKHKVHWPLTLACEVLGVSPSPDGHPKLLHFWPVKLLQAGRSDYDDCWMFAIRAAASFRR